MMQSNIKPLLLLWTLVRILHCNGRTHAFSILRYSWSSSSSSNTAKTTLCSPLQQVAAASSQTRLKGATSSSLLEDKNSFDFSSTRAWEIFYQIEQQEQQQEASASAATEWHSSVPASTLVDLIPRSSSSSSSSPNNILMIGCGTSTLPDDMLLHFPKCHFFLLDSSHTCIDILQKRYSHDRYQNRVTCLCGNVLNLVHDDGGVLPKELVGKIDCIYDKGLMDALLCSEGWNGPVQQLLQQATAVLAPNNQAGSSYVLVSYQLPKSTKEFLKECQPNLDWTFSMGSGSDNNNNSRVELSRAILI